MPNPGGTIYAIGVEGIPSVKIGRTAGPVVRRLAELQIGHPTPLAVIAHAPVERDVRQIEQAIHRFLQAERQQGEWFAVQIDQAHLEALIVRAMQWLADEEARKAAAAVERAAACKAAGTAGCIDMQALGDRVLLARQQCGLSQHALAAKAGVDVMTISRLERGKKKRLEIEPLARLAQALEVTTDHLLGRDTPARKRPRPRPAAPVG